MDINLKVKPTVKIKAFYLFFIISSLQLGVGVIQLPRLLFEHARQDAWISMLFVLSYLLFLVFVMLKILRQYESADIFGIQIDVFGKFFGKMMGWVYILYFASTMVSVIATYAEIVRVFIFPIHRFIIASLLLIIVFYTVLSGFRVIVGTCFIFFFIFNLLSILLIEPIQQMDPSNFLPLFQAGPMDIIKGAEEASFTFFGIEILLLIYPFLHNKQKAGLPSYLGICFTFLITFVIIIVSIGFFSAEQLLIREWPLLSLFKMQTFAVIERFDFIIVAEFMMLVIPTLIFFMWGITFGLKRMHKIRQKTSLCIFTILSLIASTFVELHFQITDLQHYTATIGFWLIYVYPIILLPIILLKNRWRARKGGTFNGKN